MSDGDDGRAQLGDSASLIERNRLRKELEHIPAGPDLTALYPRTSDETGRDSAPQIGIGQPGIMILPRLLAVEVLLAEPEALQDDGLESCLYMLRDRLRGSRQVMSDIAGEALPVDAGTIALPELPASSSWARRYTRFFLGACQGISADITETAELIVSELVTNAVKFGGANLISLSLRNFREALLIEVHDSNGNPPVLSSPDGGTENGRGLILVNALSKEWSYSFPPGGGKIVYCFLAKT